MYGLVTFFKGLFFKIFTIRAFSSFILVRHNTKSSYRAQSWYIKYTFSNGDTKYIKCPWFFANAVNGVGVCGTIVKFHELHSITYSFNKARWFFRGQNEHKSNYGDSYEWSNIWYFFLKKDGMDIELYRKRCLDRIFKMMKK